MRQFLKNNAGLVRLLGAITLISMPFILEGVVYIFAESSAVKLTPEEIGKQYQSIIYNDRIGRLYLGVLAVVAMIYVWHYFIDRRQDIQITRYMGDKGYIEFCTVRNKTVKSFKGKSLENEIWGTSHCNLFARIDIAGKKLVPEAKSKNRELFTHISEIISSNNDTDHMKLLLYIGEDDSDEMSKWEKRAADELSDRIAIIKQKKPHFTHSDFEAYGLCRKFLTDYLVIEDNVFITIRKPEVSNQPNAQGLKEEVTAIHIRHLEVASAYRQWLKSIAVSKTGYVNADRMSAVYRAVQV